jgi:hypothetical protein
MKKSVLISAIISLISLVTFNGYSQPKYINNPLYSSGNYKMSNHARIARKLNLDKATNYDYKDSKSKGLESSANYKNSFAKVEDNGAAVPIVPVETTNSIVASGNYKMQFRGTRKVEKSVKTKEVEIETPADQPTVTKPEN